MTIVSKILDEIDNDFATVRRQRAAGLLGFRTQDELLPASASLDPKFRGQLRDRFASAAFVLFLALLPLATVPLWPSLVEVPVLAAASFFLVSATLCSRGCYEDALRTFMLAPIFWVGTGCYLLYLAAVSIAFGSSTPPGFFADRLLLLLVMFCVTIASGRLASRDLLRAAIVKGVALAACLSLLVLAGLAIQTDGSVGTWWQRTTYEGMTAARGNIWRLFVPAFATAESDSVAQPAVIQQIAEAWAVLALLVLASAGPRTRGILWLVTAAFAGGAATVFGRPFLGGLFGVGLVWLFWIWLRSDGRRLTNFAVLVALSLGGLVLAFATDVAGHRQTLREISAVDLSIETERLDRVTEQTTMQTFGRIVFGSGPDSSDGRSRIDSLLLSSFAEGGLIGVTFVLLQYAGLFFASLLVVTRCSRSLEMRNRFASALVAVVIVAVGTTTSRLGGGFYSPAGLLAVAVFLGAATPVLAVAGDQPRFVPLASRRSLTSLLEPGRDARQRRQAADSVAS